MVEWFKRGLAGFLLLQMWASRLRVGKYHGQDHQSENQWLSKCGPTRCISITWELARNSNSLAPPQAS